MAPCSLLFEHRLPFSSCHNEKSSFSVGEELGGAPLSGGGRTPKKFAAAAEENEALWLFALATEREIKWDDKMLLFLPSEVLLFFFPFPTSFCLAPARRSFVRRWWWGDDVCSVATGGRDKSFLRFSSPHDRRGKGGRSNERKGNGGGRRTDQKLNSEQ